MTRKPIKLSHLVGHLNSLIAPRGGEEGGGSFLRSYERGYTGVTFAEVFVIEKPDAHIHYFCNLNKLYISHILTGHLALLIFIMIFFLK